MNHDFDSCFCVFSSGKDMNSSTRYETHNGRYKCAYAHLFILQNMSLVLDVSETLRNSESFRELLSVSL